MSYAKKSDAMASIKSRTVMRHGKEYTVYEAYLGTDVFTKKAIRKSATRLSKLRSEIDAFYRKLAYGGESAMLLSAYESVDAHRAIEMLREAGADASLTDCARVFLAQKETNKRSEVTLAEAFQKYLASQQGKSIGHQKAVASRVGAWVTAFGGDRSLSDVTAPLVAADLEQRLYKPSDPKTKTTYNNHLGYIKTFAAWCTAPEQAFIRDNPLKDMKLKVKEWREPEFVHAATAEKLLAALWENRTAAPADLADAVLSFFCGMRQEEIQHVRLGSSAVNINLSERYIRVIKCKGNLRGIKPRCFTIPDTALAWMKAFPFLESVKMPNKQFRKHLVAIADQLKITLPMNAGRHTFITMYSAAFKDQVELTKIVGNSEDVRDAHYDGICSEKEGREFFAILPPAAEAVNQPSPDPERR